MATTYVYVQTSATTLLHDFIVRRPALPLLRRRRRITRKQPCEHAALRCGAGQNRSERDGRQHAGVRVLGMVLLKKI